MKYQQLLRNQMHTQPIEANIDRDQNLVKAIAAGEQTALAELPDIATSTPVFALWAVPVRAGWVSAIRSTLSESSLEKCQRCPLLNPSS